MNTLSILAQDEIHENSTGFTKRFQQEFGFCYVFTHEILGSIRNVVQNAQFVISNLSTLLIFYFEVF